MTVEELQKELAECEARIEYALAHCTTCSKKPGMPQLCEACLALQIGQWQVSKEPFLVRTPDGVKTFEEWYRR